jgi:hypothetical protein
LIEYTGAWKPRAIEDSDFSPRVKEWIAHQRATRDHFFPVLIRQHYRPLQEITCFVGIVREDRPLIYRFTFSDYEQLTSLDIDALAAGDPRYFANRSTQELYLVCTHGKHDMCCAKYGQPVYQELSRRVGKLAWQSSHLGGDKYAANIVYLPKSLYYGRMNVQDIDTMLSLHKRRQIYLEKYRGCTSYSYVEQAADFFIRTNAGVRTLNALRRLSTWKRPGSSEFAVVFEEIETHNIYQVTVIETVQEVPSITSCKGCWRNPIRNYTVTGYNLVQTRRRHLSIAV